MSKAIGKTLKIVAIAAAVVFTAGVAAVYGFATAATVLFASGVAKGALALYAIGSALDPPSISSPNLKNQQGQNLQLTGDPANVQWHILGQAAVGGNLVARFTTGTKNENLWLVIELAGHPCDSLVKFEYDGTEITFSSNNAVGTYANKMYLWFMDGDEAQTAHADLVSAVTEWTSNHKGGGVCHAVVKLVYDPELFGAGIQNMRFTIKGASAYDPRLDSTRTEVLGASGSHRVDDQSTWEWTDNPALLAARYKYGYRKNGVLVYGRAIPDNRIHWNEVAEAADACDESVALKAGGTEKRYTCNGIHFPNQSHNNNMSAIATSMAGFIFHSRGWRMRAGVPRTSTLNRETSEFIGPVKTRAEIDPRDKYNGIKGLFADANQRYELVDLPSLTVDDFLTADNNQPNLLDRSLPFTTSSSMGQRILKILLMRTRMRRTLDVTVGSIGLLDDVGDTAQVTHLPANIDDMKMIIQGWRLDFAQTDTGMGFLIRQRMVEEDDDLIYSWDETTEEQTPVSGATVNRYNKEPYEASYVESVVGTTGESVFNRTDGALEQGGVLVQGITVNQGDDESRVVTKGVAYGEANDGDSVTFSRSWSDETIPEVKFTTGGISTSSTLTDPVAQEFRALNVTKTGFTASLRLKELTGTITPVTDTGATEDVTDTQFSMDKSVTAEAYDDKYTFQFDCSVGNQYEPEGGVWLPGQIVVGIYLDDGGGFVQYGTITVNGDTGGLTTTRNNQVKTVEVDGIGQIGTKEFRIVLESDLYGTSTIDAFDSVSYGTASAPSDESATPTGADPVKYQVIGGIETV